jgi:hypothetical protein
MEKLQLDKSVKTPLIIANPNGEIKIEGISVPENALEFYEVFKNWMDNYELNPAGKTVCEIKLDYFNTSTANILLNFLKRLNKLHLSGKIVEINWYHLPNDFEIEESGNDFKSLVSVPFNIIKIE